jgi:hypothetical protein
MPDIKVHHPENKNLFLGNNEFETSVLTVPANTAIPAGALLKRVDDKFAPVLDTSPAQITVDINGDTGTIPGNPVDIPAAVNPAEIKNTAPAPADIPFRALVSGKVRQDMLSVDGRPVTTAQADMLRMYGIIPRRLNDISRTEN